MSGGDYTYNRFDQFEKSLLEGKECKKCGPDCDCDSCKGKKSKKGAKPDYLDLDKDGDKEEDMEDAAEGMSEKGTKSLKKEALEATGLFTSEEIEHISEVLGLGKN